MYGVGGAAVGQEGLRELMEEALMKAINKKLEEEAHMTKGEPTATYRRCTTSYRDEEENMTVIGCQICDQIYAQTSMRKTHPDNVEVTVTQNCEDGCPYHE